MVTIKKGKIQGFQDRQVSYTLFKQDNTFNKLAILLPGLGYTVQAPLLHFSTGLFLQRSYDVLHINYQYTHESYDEFPDEMLSEIIRYDVRKSIDHMIDSGQYNRFIFIAKSLGTIALSSELTRDVFSSAKAIWLTPLLQRDEVFKAMHASNNNGLSFIGDADPCYIKERMDQVAKNAAIKSIVIPKVNHSLEYEQDVSDSIEVLKQVMIEIEEFEKAQP